MLFNIDYQLTQLNEFIKNFRFQAKKSVILHGQPGTGKTESVYFIAEKINYEVIEFNASDERTTDFIKDFKAAIQTMSLQRNSLILLDEADGILKNVQEKLVKLILKSKKPIILIVNNLSKIIRELRDISYLIYYPQPSISERISFIKRFTNDFDFSKVKNLPDYRQLKLAIEHYTDGYKSSLKQKERLLKMLNSGNYNEIERSSKISDDDLTYLLDNSVHLHGVKLWQFIEGLSALDLTNKPYAINEIPIKIKKEMLLDSFSTKVRGR